MRVRIMDKCWLCLVEYEKDSEKFFWHLRIHLVTEELAFQYKKEKNYISPTLKE